MSNKKILEARDQVWQIVSMLHETRMESDELMQLADSEEWLYDYQRPLMGVLMRLDRLAKKVGPEDD